MIHYTEEVKRIQKELKTQLTGEIALITNPKWMSYKGKPISPAPGEIPIASIHNANPTTVHTILNTLITIADQPFIHIKHHMEDNSTLPSAYISLQLPN